MSQTVYSIIVPCYNEGHVIGAMIDGVVRHCEERGEAYEVLIVDDGSVDESASVITEQAEKYDTVRALLLPENQGKGSAIRHGMTYACGEIILFIDGDCEIGVDNIGMFLDLFSHEAYVDVVIGSKFCEGGERHASWKRHIFSTVYRIMNRILFGLAIEDTQMGIKAMRRHVRTRLLPYLHINGYAFDIEFLIHASRHDFTIREKSVEIMIDPTQSRITHLSIVEMIRDTFSVYHSFLRRDVSQLLRREQVRIRLASFRHLAVFPLAFAGSAATRGIIIIISLMLVCATLITKNKATCVDHCADTQQ